VSVKIFAELHPASSKRTELEAAPGTVAEIIASLNTGFALSQARVSLNGEIVTDFSKEAKDGDTLWVKFIPAGNTQETGTTLKVGGWWLIALGIVSCFIPGVGLMIGPAMIGTGVSMTLAGAVLLNTHIPSLKDTEKPDQDPSIRGSNNQARPHGRIPVLFGRSRIYPDIAANPYTEIIDGKQHLVQLFCAGYRDCEIDNNSFKLGETELAKFSKTKNINAVLSDSDPAVRVEIMQNGEPSALYPCCVHEDAVNAPLTHEIDDGDGGEISGEIIRTTPGKTEKIIVDIFLNGIGKYDSEGKLQTASVTVAAHYKKTGSGVWLPFDEGSSNGVWHAVLGKGFIVASGKTLETQRRLFEADGLDPGEYDVMITRVTPDSKSSKTVDMVYIGSIRSFKSAPPVSAERRKHLTLIAMRTLATGKLNGMLDSFNFTATAKMPVHDGTGSGGDCWQAAVTRSPASAILFALRGRASQQKAPVEDIDWPAFEAFYAWCEAHEYFCDAYLSEPVTVAELLGMIGGTARAEALRIDSKISIVQDIERPAPVQLFTPKNTKSYSVAMLSADVPDAIALRFPDEDAGYALNEAIVYNTPDFKRSNEPETAQKIDLWGITNSAQARRIGMYSYGCLNCRPFVHSIEVDFEYLLCAKGDRIQYAGDIALAGTTQGRVKGTVWADGLCIGIDTDEPAEFSGGLQYAVRIRMPDGSVVIKDVIYNPGKPAEKDTVYFPADSAPQDPELGEMHAVDGNNVYYEPLNALFFVDPMEAADAPEAGCLYAFGIRGYEAIDLIITEVQPGPDLCATLTCVDYSPEIFGVDDPGFAMPPFENKITPVSGAVDSGIVNPDRFRLFAAFHDGEEEPPRPTGNGQEGGWSLAQTQGSLWQSSKTAESLDSGEWGPPVRIKAQRGFDDVTPVWLAVTPPGAALAVGPDGTVLAGLLPFTAQARLFQWNSVLQGAAFSLSGAPPGVSVDAVGLITVSAGALLEAHNSITVQAEYEGETFSAGLTVTVDFRSYAPRYLGTVLAVPQGAQITVIGGPAQGTPKSLQGDYVLAVGPAAGQPAGTVFQWDGFAWNPVTAAENSSLYLACFKDGLDWPGLAEDTAWFGAVIAKQIIALKATIGELESQIIKLSGTGAVYGGNKYLANGAADPLAPPNAKGFWLGANGDAKFENGSFKGNIEADSGHFSGTVELNLKGAAGRFPLLGGVHAYAWSHGISGQPLTDWSVRSGNIDSVEYLSTGKYRLHYKAMVNLSPANNAIMASGFVSRVSNPYPQPDTLSGQVDVSYSYDYYTDGGMASAIDFEFRSSAGVLVNPALMRILFIN